MDRTGLDAALSCLDSLDAAGLASRFAPDGMLVLGGARPVVGRGAVEKALHEYFSLFEKLIRKLRDTWEVPGALVQEGEIRYRLHGGVKVSVPTTLVIRARNGGIAELRLYHDPAALLAAARAEPGPPELQVRHEEQGVQGSFYVVQDGRRVGELSYTAAGPRLMVIDHTEVGPELRGRGAGQRLVEESVRWARSTGRRVLPLCPYARAVLARQGEALDVMAPP